VKHWNRLSTGLVGAASLETLYDLIDVCKYLNRDCKENGARLFSVVPSERIGGNAHKQQVPSEHQETLLYCEHDRTLVQVAQRDCGVSFLRDTKKPSGHSPGKLAVGGPA